MQENLRVRAYASIEAVIRVKLFVIMVIKTHVNQNQKSVNLHSISMVGGQSFVNFVPSLEM